MGMHATKDRVESDNRLLNILVRVHNHYTRWTLVWWIEVGLRCKKKDSQLLRAIVYWGAPRRLLERREPGLDSERFRAKDEIDRGLLIPHLIGGRKRIDISMWDSLFHLSWERTAKSIRTVQWRIRGEQRKRQSPAKCGTDTDQKKKWGGETSSFPSLPGPQSSAVFPGQIKDLGLHAT